MNMADLNSDWQIDSYNLPAYSLVWFLNIHADFSLEEMFQFVAEENGFVRKITVSYRKLRERTQISII
jgi:hypothetical protein